MSQITEEHRPLENERWDSISLGSVNAEREIIQEEAHMLLQESPYRELWDVACDFQGGVLTLRGRVPSYFLKQVAQTIVFVMERVETINNRLEVIASQNGSR
jgi:hypothetical protein